MDRIRLINEKDFPTLAIYWALDGSYLDPHTIYPKDSSYIYERDGEILYAVALHKIEGLPRAYVEGFIRNPHKQSDFSAVEALQSYLDNAAKSAGINMLYAVTKDAGVYRHHKRIGYENLPVMLYTSIRRL